MQHSSDAAFFDMVHALVAQPCEQNTERRQDERHAYQCVQLLAPYDGSNLPAQRDFDKVHCEDISAKGFAFYTSTLPGTNYVIVALGVVPFIFYTAEVLHSRPVERENGTEYLVGCRLLKRLTS